MRKRLIVKLLVLMMASIAFAHTETRFPLMALAKLDVKTVQNADSTFTVSVSNQSQVPALMIRLNLINKKTGEQILPAFYEDNYFSLLGGETKTINIRYLTNEPPAGKHFRRAVTVEQLR